MKKRPSRKNPSIFQSQNQLNHYDTDCSNCFYFPTGNSFSLTKDNNVSLNKKFACRSRTINCSFRNGGFGKEFRLGRRKLFFVWNRLIGDRSTTWTGQFLLRLRDIFGWLDLIFVFFRNKCNIYFNILNRIIFSSL